MEPAAPPDYPVGESNPKRSRNVLVRFGHWLRQKPYRIYILVGIVLIAAGSGVAASILLKPMPAIKVATVKTPVVVKQAPVPIYSPLTGAKVDDVTLTTRPITAIMIENSPDARPQSGVKQAGIVYEAIAEGGITRFLALYQEAQPGLVGPVRSLRMYFLDWATPYNPGIVHVGGSAAALSEVRNGNYNDLDQFFNGSAFWRSTDRYAPHNVYTSFDNLNKLEQSKGITSSTFVGFLRADGKPSDAPDATSVDINFSGPLYNTHYDYDTASNTYLRNVGGVASMDREDGQISPSVVIAMKVDMSLILQDGYREAITTTGSGVADIFQNGAVIEATWKKDGRTAPLQFFDASGNEISLNRGQTWIAAVPNGSGSVSWQ